MKLHIKDMAATLAIAFLLFNASCQERSDASAVSASPSPANVPSSFEQHQLPQRPASNIPNLQAELLDSRNKTSNSPLASFDFKNFSYPLPRGWQNPDNSDVKLTNGRLEPISVDIHEEMSDDEKSQARSTRRIGMSYVTTKYMDATGDGQDEAFVVLKVETTGSAIPQFVYVFDWKDSQPQLIWYFRTGDRADGGLKDLRVENGTLVLELYGQDRFLLGEAETSKVTGDEEQLCCPTYFTRTYYKWNGKTFSIDKDRWTYSVADPSAQPLRNILETIEKNKLQTPARKRA